MAIKPRIDPHWARILERIQEDDCISIHKFWSSELGFAYLTDKKGHPPQTGAVDGYG
jgi:hypothetical protein